VRFSLYNCSGIKVTKLVTLPSTYYTAYVYGWAKKLDLFIKFMTNVCDDVERRSRLER